ncbi:MAG TPA: hypothetical protein VNH46_12130 [Gemmatimonadales bacterium]|nr:hypothetical protein [Gemmatimonadales bacterium]
MLLNLPITARFPVADTWLVGLIQDLLHRGDVHRLTVRDEDENIMLDVALRRGALQSLAPSLWNWLRRLAPGASDYTVAVELLPEGPAPPRGGRLESAGTGHDPEC